MSSCRLKCNLCHLLGFIIADISNQYFFPQTGQQLALRNPQEDFSSALNCPRGSSKWALITPRGQGQSAPSAWSLRIRQRQGVRDRPSETDRERWSRTGRTPGSGAGPPPRRPTVGGGHAEAGGPPGCDGEAEFGPHGPPRMPRPEGCKGQGLSWCPLGLQAPCSMSHLSWEALGPICYAAEANWYKGRGTWVGVLALLLSR